MPFDNNDVSVLRKQISNGDYYEPTEPSEAAGLIRHLLTVNPAKRATIEDVLEHWWVNLGYNITPNNEPYPSPSLLESMNKRYSLSSDSDGDEEVTVTSHTSSPKLKGILKKDNLFSRDTKRTLIQVNEQKPCDTLINGANDSVCDNTNGARHKVLGTDSERISITGDTDSRKTEDASKVFDSERMPKRSILKKKGKFSGGDSGILVDKSRKSSEESTVIMPSKCDLSYDICDIEAILDVPPVQDEQCNTNRSQAKASTSSEIFSDQYSSDTFSDVIRQELNVKTNLLQHTCGNVSCLCDCMKTRTVQRRKGILKKPVQDGDASKRLSVGSTGSTSSGDILDLSFESYDSERFITCARTDICLDNTAQIDRLSSNLEVLLISESARMCEPPTKSAAQGTYVSSSKERQSSRQLPGNCHQVV